MMKRFVPSSLTVSSGAAQLVVPRFVFCCKFHPVEGDGAADGINPARARAAAAVYRGPVNRITLRVRQRRQCQQKSERVECFHNGREFKNS